MDAEYPPGVPAVAADFLPEASAQSGVFERQSVGGKPLVAVESGDRLLGSRNQVLLVDRRVGSIFRSFTYLVNTELSNITENIVL